MEALEEQAVGVFAIWKCGVDRKCGDIGDGFKKRRRFDGGDLVSRRGFLRIDWGVLRLVCHWTTGFFLRVVFFGDFPFVGIDAFVLSQVSDARLGAPMVLLIDALLFFPGLKPSASCGSFSGA
jgi:hypothetical protein